MFFVSLHTDTFSRGTFIRRSPLGLWKLAAIIYRGYYTVARKYEFYVPVAKTISHGWAKRTKEIILLLPLENKIHIFEPTCSFYYIDKYNRTESKSKTSKKTYVNTCSTATKISSISLFVFYFVRTLWLVWSHMKFPSSSLHFPALY